VSDKATEDRGFLTKTVSLKWVLIGVGALVIVMAAIIVTVLLVDRHRDNDRRAAAAAATSTTEVTSPYDLTEMPVDTNLDVVEDAAFVSIYVPNESGKLTSYGISSGLPAAEALTKAIKRADKVDGVVATATAGGADVSTITFVFPTRDTLTFTLDIERGLIARGDQAWRPDGDLAALVKAATAGPQ
jgi:hypothetical protein